MDPSTQTQPNTDGGIQTAAGDADALPLSPKLLLQRLKIEAQLKRTGAGMSVSRNQIRLRASNHIATISVEQTASGAIGVDIEAIGGEVLLDEGLAEFVSAKNQQINPIQIEVTADRVVRVKWHGEFTGDVEAAHVVEALFAVAAVVKSVQTAMTEDFFLTSPCRSLVSQEAKKEAA